MCLTNGWVLKVMISEIRNWELGIGNWELLILPKLKKLWLGEERKITCLQAGCFAWQTYFDNLAGIAVIQS
jgi:hypothetical protein